MKKGKGRVSRIVLVVFGLLTIGSAGMMANAAGNITNEDFTSKLYRQCICCFG